MSEEHRRKISDAQKGRRFTDEHRAKLRGPRPHAIPWNKGKSIYLGGGFKEGHIPWNKGKPQPEETKLKCRLANIGRFVGAKGSAWKGGITPEHERIRHSLEYQEWRQAVFERDGYACIECGDNRGGNLEADHIKPFAFFTELRFDTDNGRTLCHDCHTKTPTYGRKAEAYAL